METEQDRLQKLYGEMGDEHLLDLDDDKDDLTDEARLVLAQELRRRGLAPQPPVEEATIPFVEPELENGFGPGIPGIFPSSAAVMEQALEPPQSPSHGRSSLIAFYDGIELAKACAILEDAEMEPVIEPVEGDAMSGVPPRFEVWLLQRDIEPAKALLRLKMGLFPLPEVEGDGDPEASESGLVGVFETAAEAEEVRTVLLAAGISATVEQDPEYNEWEVSVAPEDQERAVAVVAGGMGLN